MSYFKIIWVDEKVQNKENMRFFKLVEIINEDKTEE